MLRKMFFVVSREWDKEKIDKTLRWNDSNESSWVSVYQAVHRGFNLKSLDKTLVCDHLNEDIKAHTLSFGNFSLVYRKT